MLNQKNNNTVSTDIIIIGAGTPGLSLAILLSELGLKIAVVDINTPPKLNSESNTTRTSALMEGTIELLSQTGSWKLCQEYGEELRSLKIIDPTKTSLSKETVVDFHAKDIGLERFAVNMPNNRLLAALYHEAKLRNNIKFFIPSKLRNIIFDEFCVEAVLDDTSRINGRLIIGSDGRNSITRKIADIDCTYKEYNQKAITAIIKHSEPHNNTSTEIHRDGGPFTMVPLPRNTSSIVWVEKDEQADHYYNLEQKEFLKSLNEKSNNLLGSIELASEPEMWPLIGQTSQELISHRVILIAEAAHVLHPLGAQGLNLSIKDVSSLVKLMKKAIRSGQDIGSNVILSRYKKERQPDTVLRFKSIDSLNKLITNEFPFSTHLRKAGLFSLNNCTPLKQLAMRYGMTTEY